MNQPEDGGRYREALLAETREELQKADAKASILLAATGIAFSALLAAAGAGTWSPEKLHHGDARLAIWCSLALALAGVCILGGAVIPRLRARTMDREKLHYFGNVRAFWPTLWPLRHRKQRRDEGRLAFETALKNASTKEIMKHVWMTKSGFLVASHFESTDSSLSACGYSRSR